MGAKTKIQWTDHTFNCWWGCTRVSPGCENCYAETFAKRFGVQWGAKEKRRLFGNKHWAEPLTWNTAAAHAGERRRVFCASMADVFEARRDLDDERTRLWTLIVQTPHLDWQLLTKRPDNMLRLTPPWWRSSWPPNAWAGCTVEDQLRADERIPDLLKVPALHFLSCEPLLSAVDLTRLHDDEMGARWNALTMGIDWVICGGESGRNARPMQLDWVRSLRDQCVAAGVAFHFKQWGQSAPPDQLPDETARAVDAQDPSFMHSKFVTLRKKHDAGRLLDGRTWDEFPKVGGRA